MSTTIIIWAAVGFIALLLVAFSSYKVFGIDKVQNWLLWAVTQAEGAFGTGTGKLKLAYVYDMFISKFPKMQAVIPYRLFTALVDKALVLMREMLKNNKISDIVDQIEQRVSR